MTPPNILSIAGSDPSGGAGVQADLKAIAANGGYGMAALTALTAQNTRGVTGVELVAPDFVAQQIDAVFDDVTVDAVKIGMIATAEIAGAVASVLESRRARGNGPKWIVLDPVMIAKSGDALLADDAIGALRERLLPLADIVTPNLPEAAALIGEAEAVSREQMPAVGAKLLSLGPRAALVKGGHLASGGSPDYLAASGVERWFEGPRVTTKNTHGTGCTLSSALAAQLALTSDLATACGNAKAYVAGAIAAADELKVGGGHGPLNHFQALWRGDGLR